MEMVSTPVVMYQQVPVHPLVAAVPSIPTEAKTWPPDQIQPIAPAANATAAKTSSTSSIMVRMDQLWTWPWIWPRITMESTH